MCSWVFGHLYIDGETVQMNSCTKGIHVPDMKQKKENQASNTVHTQTPGSYPKESLLHLQHGENLNLKSRTVHFTKALLVTSGRHPSLSHTSMLGPWLFCSVLRVAHYPQLCILLPYNPQTTISSEECILRCYLKTSGIHLTCISEPPIQWFQGVPSLGWKWPVPKVDSLLPCSAKAKNE
jgi:hypothetical protein